MKKVILVGAIALLGLASCKKDYTCECKVYLGGEEFPESILNKNVSYTNETESDATSKCATEDGYLKGTVKDIPNISGSCNLK